LQKDGYAIILEQNRELEEQVRQLLSENEKYQELEKI